MEHTETHYRSDTLMLDIYAGSPMSESLQELRMATAAFLTDIYDDGTYVATPDDIDELQKATAAFLSDMAGSEVFCGDDASPGLLLPGEQFLLPIPIATDRFRSTHEATIKETSSSDQCCNHDVAEILGANEVQDILPQKVKPTELLPTTEHQGQWQPPQQYRHDSLDGLLNQPIKMNEPLNAHANADSDDSNDFMDASLDATGQAFDASGGFSRIHASNAASFFDLLADAVIPYTAFDQLLEMEDGNMQLPCVQPGSEHESHRLSDESKDASGKSVQMMVLMDSIDTLEDVDGINLVCNQFPLPPNAHYIQDGESKVIVCSFANWKHDTCSVTSTCPMGPAHQRGLLTPFELRQEKSPGEEEKSPLGQSGAGNFNSFFADDVWTSTPNLGLILPTDPPVFAELVDGARVSKPEPSMLSSACCCSDRWSELFPVCPYCSMYW